MENIFKNIELVIFDLDGTLYEDTDHFDYYAEQLEKEIPQQSRAAFMSEYRKMEAGDHIVTIGKVYDAARDHVLKLDPASLKVTEAWTWEGTRLDEETINKLYPDAVSLDFDNMIAIGDGWWLPNVCARHYGAQDTQRAYVKTKDYMATDQFKLTKIKGLREGIRKLAETKHVVLVTNSEKDDVKRLLKNLDLEGIFTEIVTEARKPQLTKNHFSLLLERFNTEPEKAISIGDNYINEIAPAINLSMQTVFIDLYELDYPEYKGYKVKSISNIIEQMNEA